MALMIARIGAYFIVRTWRALSSVFDLFEHCLTATLVIPAAMIAAGLPHH
jgi:hypothetical protein